MAFDLQFITTTSDSNTFRELALNHGIRVQKKETTGNVVTWVIETDEDLAQLCNFMNEAGAQGVRVTVSGVE